MRSAMEVLSWVIFVMAVPGIILGLGVVSFVKMTALRWLLRDWLKKTRGR